MFIHINAFHLPCDKDILPHIGLDYDDVTGHCTNKYTSLISVLWVFVGGRAAAGPHVADKKRLQCSFL